MECPNCGKDSVVEAHVDSFPCADCGAVIKISYCVCENCSLAFRLNNGRFLDGGMPSKEERRIARALENAVNEAFTDTILNNMTMAEYVQHLHTCIKCGSMAVTADKNMFQCAKCGFEWEILE